jgi:hypothetical protein
LDVTNAIVAGNLEFPNLARGESRTITLRVRVGAGVANGAQRSFLVTAASTGAGAAKDAVKATVRAT